MTPKEILHYECTGELPVLEIIPIYRPTIEACKRIWTGKRYGNREIYQCEPQASRINCEQVIEKMFNQWSPP